MMMMMMTTFSERWEVCCSVDQKGAVYCESWSGSLSSGCDGGRRFLFYCLTFEKKTIMGTRVERH